MHWFDPARKRFLSTPMYYWNDIPVAPLPAWLSTPGSLVIRITFNPLSSPNVGSLYHDLVVPSNYLEWLDILMADPEKMFRSIGWTYTASKPKPRTAEKKAADLLSELGL